MMNHLLVQAILLAAALLTKACAFVEIVPTSRTTASKGAIPENSSFYQDDNVILKKIRSSVAEYSFCTSRLFVFKDSEDNYYDGAIQDATRRNEQWSTADEVWMGSSLTMSEVDTMKDAKTATAETKSSEIESYSAPEIIVTTGSESLTAASASPQSSSTALQSIKRGSSSGLTTTPGFSAGTSIGTVAFGGLAVARNVLSQRQQKLDEEQRNLVKQQKRLESEVAKLRKYTSQNNFFLSTIGSVAVGTALSTGGLVEEITESTVRSVEGMIDGLVLENSIDDKLEGGGFKTTPRTVVERPPLNQQELPYLEKEIQQITSKQQAKEKTTNVLTKKKETLLLKQNELEDMTLKREAAIAKEEERLKAIADEGERLRFQEGRRILAEKNEAARLNKEAEAAQIKLAEEERLKKIEEEARIKEAEEARVQKEAEEARLQKEAEEARLQKEAEEARLQKEAEEARIQKEVEEARIQKEKNEEADRLRLLEETSMEMAIQESMTREQNTLKIFSQQQEELVLQEQQSPASSPIEVGVEVLHEYANRFSDSLIPYQPSSLVDTEKLQLLLKQLGLSPGLAVGIVGTLVIGGSVTAIKRIIDEAEEIENRSASKEKGSESNLSEEDGSSRQVADLLENKRNENAQVRKTLRISVEGTNDENNLRKILLSELPSASLTGLNPESQPPPSIKFGENSLQPKVAPPPGKSESNIFKPQTPLSDVAGKGTPQGKSRSEIPDSKKAITQSTNKISQSSSSNSPNIDRLAFKKTGFSTRPSPRISLSSFPGHPNSSTSSPKYASMLKQKTSGSPKSFVTSPKELAGLPDNEGVQPFSRLPKQANSAFPFRTSPQKEGSFSGYGSSPPKLLKSQINMTNSLFVADPKQSTLKNQTLSPFGTSVPKSVLPSAKKNGSRFGASKMQASFGLSKKTFPTVTSRTQPKDNSGRSVSKSAQPVSNFEPHNKKPGESSSNRVDYPFDNPLKQITTEGKAVSSFPKLGSSNPFGLSPSKSVDSPNTLRSLQKKLNGSSDVQIVSPFGSPPKKFVPGKKSVSPFGLFTEKSGPLVVGEPKKKTASQFTISSKPKLPREDRAPQYGNNSSQSSRYFGTPSKVATMVEDTKKPFRPFSRQNQSSNKSKPSFPSDGPVYMPPTAKTKNVQSLDEVYSSLNRKLANNSDSRQGKSQFKKDTLTSSRPKKSFSPFDGAKRITKSIFLDRSSNITPSAPSPTLEKTTNTNNRSTSAGIDPWPSGQQTKKIVSSDVTDQAVSASNPERASLVSNPATIKSQGIKKSYSPFGWKPKQGANDLTKMDPSSFSFSVTPTKIPFERRSTKPKSNTSFSFDPDGTSLVAENSSLSTNISAFQADTGDKSSISTIRSSYNIKAASQPFAATGFRPKDESIDRGLKGEDYRSEDLENARKKAIGASRYDQEDK